MASLHTISIVYIILTENIESSCKTTVRRNTVCPGVFVNYNTKKATASNSLQFLTVMC